MEVWGIHAYDTVRLTGIGSDILDREDQNAMFLDAIRLSWTTAVLRDWGLAILAKLVLPAIKLSG